MSLFAFSSVNANDSLKKKILELQPQADTNGDGVISDAEEAAVSSRLSRDIRRPMRMETACFRMRKSRSYFGKPRPERSGSLA